MLGVFRVQAIVDLLAQRYCYMLKLANNNLLLSFRYYKNTVKELFSYFSSFKTSLFLLNSKGEQFHGTQSATGDNYTT